MAVATTPSYSTGMWPDNRSIASATFVSGIIAFVIRKLLIKLVCEQVGWLPSLE